MKILFVIDTLYTPGNGTSISAQRFIGALRKRGHEVRALCGDTPKTEEDKLITDGDFCCGIMNFFKNLCAKFDFFYGKADPKVIKEACDWADVVHVTTPLFMGNATIQYCVEHGIHVTGAFHIQPENITGPLCFGWCKPVNDMIYSIFRRVAYNHLSHVHTPSNFIANMLHTHGYTSKMHVISNGIHDDFLHIDPSRFADKLERRPNGDKNGIFRIMMIGRLSQEKRQDVILNAMKYSKYADRIQLVFAGRGPLYNRYMRQIRSLKLKLQPEFVYLQRQQLIDALLDCDLYIHASDMEIEAISCIEAFATGLVPVIADSSLSATPQFALDERSLFKAGDPKDLARAIDYWIEHPTERHEMEKQYVAAANKYSLSNSALLMEQMFNAELNEKKTISIAAERTGVLSALKRQVARLYKRIA